MLVGRKLKFILCESKKKLIPRLSNRGNDPFQSVNSNGNRFDILGHAGIGWKPNRLRAIDRKQRCSFHNSTGLEEKQKRNLYPLGRYINLSHR